MGRQHTSGDSVTVGDKASDSAHTYANILCAALGLTRVNYAVGGDMAADQSIRTQSAILVAGDKASVMIGINDHMTYKGDAAKQEHYRNFMRRVIGNFVHPNRKSARAATKVGAWSNSDSATGIFSNTLGNKVSATVNGRFVSVGYIIHSYAACIGSLAEVLVDGAVIGSYSCDGITAPMNSKNGAKWGGGMVSFDTGVDGPHLVEVRVAASGKRIYVDDIRGSDQIPLVISVGKVIPMTPAAYAGSGSSQANVDAFNTIVESVVQEFVDMGHDVRLADTFSIMDVSVDYSPDGYHPNNAGHAKLAAKFKSSLTGPYHVDFPTTSGSTLRVHFTADDLAESWEEV